MPGRASFNSYRKHSRIVSGFFLFLLLCAACSSGTRLPDPQVVAGPSLTPALSESQTPGTPTPIPATETPEVDPTEAPLRIEYAVEPLSQEGLTLDGSPTGVGCVPVCIEMMTAYWHDAAGTPILSAQECIDRNAEQGLYAAGRGMSSSSAADELAELGYVHQMTLNASREELLEALENYGPVGVLVKTNWVPTTMNHAAVLKSYDAETDTVTLNDPYYGTEVSWSWESFDGIWGLNYAADPDYSGDVVRRVYFVIYPREG